MSDLDVEDRLRTAAVKLAVPYLNHEKKPRPSTTQATSGFEVLWDEGYIPARQMLIDDGVSATTIDAQMAVVKKLLGIIEPSDLIDFPLDLHAQIVADLLSEVAKEPIPTRLRLDERHIKSITEFRIEMWSNESQHAGRPHVKVHLKNGKAISVSLDKKPENLTPSGGLVGEASALKVVKKHRQALLKLWRETRPDTQKLDAGMKSKSKKTGTKKSKNRS